MSKKYKKLKILLFCFIVVLLLGGLYLSFSFAWSGGKQSDKVAMIGAWISGVATTILGGIALWQNKKHKMDLETLEIKRLLFDYQQKMVIILQTGNVFKDRGIMLVGWSKYNITEIIKTLPSVQDNLADIVMRIALETKKIEHFKLENDVDAGILREKMNKITTFIEQEVDNFFANKDRYEKNNTNEMINIIIKFKEIKEDFIELVLKATDPRYYEYGKKEKSNG